MLKSIFVSMVLMGIPMAHSAEASSPTPTPSFPNQLCDSAQTTCIGEEASGGIVSQIDVWYTGTLDKPGNQVEVNLDLNGGGGGQFSMTEENGAYLARIPVSKLYGYLPSEDIWGNLQIYFASAQGEDFGVPPFQLPFRPGIPSNGLAPYETLLKSCQNGQALIVAFNNGAIDQMEVLIQAGSLADQIRSDLGNVTKGLGNPTFNNGKQGVYAAPIPAETSSDENPAYVAGVEFRSLFNPGPENSPPPPFTYMKQESAYTIVQAGEGIPDFEVGAHDVTPGFNIFIDAQNTLNIQLFRTQSDNFDGVVIPGLNLGQFQIPNCQ